MKCATGIARGSGKYAIRDGGVSLLVQTTAADAGELWEMLHSEGYMNVVQALNAMGIHWAAIVEENGQRMVYGSGQISVTTPAGPVIGFVNGALVPPGVLTRLGEPSAEAGLPLISGVAPAECFEVVAVLGTGEFPAAAPQSEVKMKSADTAAFVPIVIDSSGLTGGASVGGPAGILAAGAVADASNEPHERQEPPVTQMMQVLTPPEENIPEKVEADFFDAETKLVVTPDGVAELGKAEHEKDLPQQLDSVLIDSVPPQFLADAIDPGGVAQTDSVEPGAAQALEGLEEAANDLPAELEELSLPAQMDVEPAVVQDMPEPAAVETIAVAEKSDEPALDETILPDGDFGASSAPRKSPFAALFAMSDKLAAQADETAATTTGSDQGLVTPAEEQPNGTKDPQISVAQAEENSGSNGSDHDELTQLIPDVSDTDYDGMTRMFAASNTDDGDHDGMTRIFTVEQGQPEDAVSGASPEPIVEAVIDPVIPAPPQPSQVASEAEENEVAAVQTDDNYSDHDGMTRMFTAEQAQEASTGQEPPLEVPALSVPAVPVPPVPPVSSLPPLPPLEVPGLIDEDPVPPQDAPIPAAMPVMPPLPTPSVYVGDSEQAQPPQVPKAHMPTMEVPAEDDEIEAHPQVELEGDHDGLTILPPDLESTIASEEAKPEPQPVVAVAEVPEPVSGPTSDLPSEVVSVPAPTPDPEEIPVPAENPDPEPVPVPVLAPEPVVAAASPQGTVPAAVCVNGHPNPPRQSICRSCEFPVSDERILIEPPLLAKAIFTNGDEFELDADIHIGRRPQVAAKPGQPTPHLVQLRDETVSRNHCRIVVDGWDIILIDEHSTNGTVLVRPGTDPIRVEGGQENLLQIGDIVVVSPETSIRIEAL